MIQPPDTNKEISEKEFGKVFSTEALNFDFDFLVKTLEDVHPNPYKSYSH
jgi:hypothetical protein